MGPAAFAAATGTTLATVSAVAVGASLVSTVATMTMKPPGHTIEGRPEDFKADPSASVPYIMGRTIAGGYIVHREAYGGEVSDVENPYQAFAIIWSGGGPVQEIESFTVDRTAVTFDGSGAVTTADYIRGGEPYMWLKTQLGASPEASALALPSPVSAIPNWGATYKLSGYAAGLWALRFDKKAKIYAAGVPRPGAIIKGVKVYDPRLDSTYPGGMGTCRVLDESTYVYSENPWLHALTFALGRWQNGKRVLGIGMAIAGISVADYVEAANVADANGWTIGGTISSGDDKWKSLGLMAQAGGGEPIRMAAKLGCIVSTPRVSLATVTSADLIGKGTVVATQPRRSRINGIIPRIRSEAHGWEVVPLDVVRPSTYLAEDGEARTRERDMQLVQDKDQASELAAYEVVNSREFGPITLPLKIRFLGYKPGDCLTLDIPELGLNAQPAIVINRSLDPVSGTVTLELKSETPAKHDFALGRIGVAPPTPGLTPPDITDVSAPAIGSWTATGGVVESDGGQIPAIIIFGGATVSTLDAIIFEYRKVGDATWTMAGTEDPATTRKEIVGLPPSQPYDVAVSYVVRGVTGTRLVLGPVTTGIWSIIGELQARLTVPSVQLEASYFGVVSDYSPAQGEWEILAGTVDVGSYFTITTAPGGNPDGLSTAYVGRAYAVSGGFDGINDAANLTMRATGSGPFAAVTLDRMFRLTKVREPYALDATPPATPAGLALSSALRTDTDGTQKIYLTATWSANADSDLNHYRLLLRESGGNFVEYQVSGTRFEVQALGGVTYEAQLQAVDHAGNVSNTYPTPPAVISHTAAADSAAPSAPTGLTATAGVRIIHLTWTNPADTDLHHVDIYQNTTNNSGTATRVGQKLVEPGTAGYVPVSGLTTNVTRYYWLKAVDTSGNASAFTSVASATTAAVGNDDIFAGSLYANRLVVSGNATQDALPTGITVGVSGTTIGTIDTRASDPITRANSQSTKILPGLVQISGATTLQDWRNGSDNTKIEGGAIAANTLEVNSATIGLRGMAIEGIEFTANSPGVNQVSWTAGSFRYMGNDGAAASHNVNGGSATWTSGVLYIYMDFGLGGASLFTTTSQATATGSNKVMIATYTGGAGNVNATYSRTIIDGDKIKTDTVNANRLLATTISSRELATTTLISQSSQLGNAVVSTLKIDGASIFAAQAYSFSDIAIPNTGAEQTVGTSGTVTIGDSVYGGAEVKVEGIYDGTSDDDSGVAIYLEISINGGGWTRYATMWAGSKVTSGAAYAYIPVAQSYPVSGAAYATLQARLIVGAIAMPGRTIRASNFRQGRIVIGALKR